MSRRAGLVVLAAAAVAAPASAAIDHGSHAAPASAVAIGFSTYTPAKVTVVPGEQIRFRNDSARAHTVTADDGSFDSGRMSSGATFDLAAHETGDFNYHCTLHAGINGTVEVRTLVLASPATGASAGRAFPLRGRTSLAPRTELTIEADSGNGYVDAGRTTVQPDGSFSTQVTPAATAGYRVVAGEEASNTVRLLVLDRSVTLTARRTRGRDVLTATVTPPAPGAHVVLQLNLPDRFGWWPVQRGRLDSRSRVRFDIHTRRRLPARVRLTLADGATTLAESRVLHVGPVRKRSRGSGHKH